MITFFIMVGILTILLTLFVWFTPWSETGVENSWTTQVELGTPDFYKAAGAIAHAPFIPLPKDEEPIVLNNGDEFVPDLIKEIKNAKSSITIANYIFKKGELTDELFDALTHKAKEGIQVKVFMDAKGSLRAPKDKVKELKDAGGQVATFRPIGIRTLTRVNKRTHLRAIVIDGRIGYTGGFSFDDEWLGNGTTPKEWRDVMVKFGPTGAREIQHMFVDLWRQTTGEILTGDTFYPPLPARTIEDTCAGSCIVSLYHTPSPDIDKNLSDLLWISIMGAKGHIILETPYLLPNKNILKALESKAAEGVRVDVLVPGPYVDSRIVQIASRSYYTALLDAGIHIYEYQPAHLHSKIFTADGHWSIVGSANLDNRSSALNIEGVVGVESTQLAADIEKELALDKSLSKELTKDTLELNFVDHILGRISRLFAKQY